jgi:hypothetical protein
MSATSSWLRISDPLASSYLYVSGDLLANWFTTRDKIVWLGKYAGFTERTARRYIYFFPISYISFHVRGHSVLFSASVIMEMTTVFYLLFP